jgi:hypothetical protein
VKERRSGGSGRCCHRRYSADDDTGMLARRALRSGRRARSSASGRPSIVRASESMLFVTVHTLSMNREQIPHERRDVACGTLFVPAALIAAAHVEKGAFDSMFWISCAVASIAWLCAYRKWAPVVGLLAFLAFRFAVGFMLGPKLWKLAGFAATTSLLAGILWLRRDAR